MKCYEVYNFNFCLPASRCEARRAGLLNFEFIFMPITQTAKRSLRKSLKQQEKNLQRKTLLKKTKKQFLKALDANDLEGAKKTLSLLYKLLDKASKTNLLKKNKVARDKSRLAKKLSPKAQGIKKTA